MRYNEVSLYILRRLVNAQTSQLADSKTYIFNTTSKSNPNPNSTDSVE